METTVAGIKRRASYWCDGSKVPEAKRLCFFPFFLNYKEANMAACFLNLIMLCPDNESVTIYRRAIVSPTL